MKRKLLLIPAAAYGVAVIALSPWKSAIEGYRAMRSLGEGLSGAMDAIAAETNAHVEDVAGKYLDNSGDPE